AALAACAALVVGLTGGPRQPAGVAFNLPAAPAGKIYEIWFVRQGHAVRAGLAHGGRTRVTHVPRGAAVAVTLEPAGGSPKPTGPLLMKTETAWAPMQTVSVFIRGQTEAETPARNLAHHSDEALLALCSRADENALGELYDRYGRVAYGLALPIGPEPAVAGRAG